jgi:hypothetical protein
MRKKSEQPLKNFQTLQWRSAKQFTPSRIVTHLPQLKNQRQRKVIRMKKRRRRMMKRRIEYLEFSK